MHGSLTLDLAHMLSPLSRPLTADPPYCTVLCFSSMWAMVDHVRIYWTARSEFVCAT